MTTELLYAVGAVAGALAACVPVLRARRRWRRVLSRRAAIVERPRLRQSTLRPTTSGWRWPAAGGGSGAAVGLVLGGPVAGIVLAAYAMAGVVLWRRRATKRDEAQSRVGAVDAVAALAAELRAGVAIGPALAAVRASIDGPDVVGADARMVKERLESAVELAETSGAPLADVLDRLDTHLRAAERARATAEAQAAGALASAGLLAVMPVAGAGLGVLVGLDPAQVLLRTPLGAACLCGAVLLQLAGLAWSARLSRVEVAA